MVTASGGPGGPVGRIAGQGCLELRGDSRKEHSGLLPFTQDRGNRVPVEELSAAPAAAQQLALPRSGGVEEMHNPPMTSFTRSPRCLHVSSRAATCRATCQSTSLAAVLGTSSATSPLLLQGWPMDKHDFWLQLGW